MGIILIKFNNLHLISILITKFISNEYFSYCLSLAIAVDFSISNTNDASPSFANDVECIIRSICKPFRRHNLQVFLYFQVLNEI